MSTPTDAPTYRQTQSPIRGVLWMVAAAVFFSITFGLVRHLSESIHAFEQTFFRQVIGVIILLPFMFHQGRAAFVTHQVKVNIVRNLFGYTGILLSFWSVTLIPLSLSLSLQFTLPLFTILFAYILLRERPGAHRWIATALGFAGAVVILRPGVVELSSGMLVAIGAAASFGVSDTLCRKLGQTDPTSSIVFYSFAVHVPLSIPLAVMNWVTPAAADWPWIIAMAVMSFCAQWSLSKAFILAEASLVSPVLFLRLPMVSAIGFIYFGQNTDVWTWIGATIILAATVYAARRETAQAQ